MADFMIRFLLCSLFLGVVICLFLAVKRICRNILTSSMQYHLWFLLLALLAVPFLPFRPMEFSQIFFWFENLSRLPDSNITFAEKTAEGAPLLNTADWMKDFALSADSRTASQTGLLLFGIWILGIVWMTARLLKAAWHLRILKKSALPLQNLEVRRLYQRCRKETNITRDIPVCSTAFLKSPMTAGCLKPCIYLPIHLISDYREPDMRYILLHELQHCRRRDNLVNILMNLAGILYWFHPLVWYGLKEMRTEREIACDASVLQMLTEDSYEDYGRTLIDFAEKMSRISFPFASGISGNGKQIRRRILNIASYQKPTIQKKLGSTVSFLMTAFLLLCSAPLVSTYAADKEYYRWNVEEERISQRDLSSYFGTYEGSFVLYDLKGDTWYIHNMNSASHRTAPDSTYKIYDALFGLEEGIITPEHSLISWNRETFPFSSWNADQTLDSAMEHSVNWYFQSIDQQIGALTLRRRLQEINYGNAQIRENSSAYWMESSLKISPIEQVELLTKLHQGELDFAPENVLAVKNSIRLSSSESGALYGKTGTGQVEGQNQNGWFVGYAQTSGNTYFFAANIQAQQEASGSRAAEITMSILADWKIWEE